MTRTNRSRRRSYRSRRRSRHSRRRSHKSRKSYSWIKRSGKLGGPGFLHKSPKRQKTLLNKCVKKYGYRSCLGSVMVLERNSVIRKKYGNSLKRMRTYLKEKY